MMKKIILLMAVFALNTQANDFAFKLYDQLKEIKGNLFFSPMSIESALAMVREGAAGNTLQQMDQLLPKTTSFPMVGNNVVLENATAL